MTTVAALLDAMAAPSTLRALPAPEARAVLEQLAQVNLNAAVDRTWALVEETHADQHRDLLELNVAQLRAQVWRRGELTVRDAERALIGEQDADVLVEILSRYAVSDEAAAALTPLPDGLVRALLTGEDTAAYPAPVVLDLVRAFAHLDPGAQLEGAWVLMSSVCRYPQVALAVVADQSVGAAVRLAACGNDAVNAAVVLAVLDEAALVEISDISDEVVSHALRALCRRRVRLEDELFVLAGVFERIGRIAEEVPGRPLALRQARMRQNPPPARHLETLRRIVRTAGSPTELSDIVGYLRPGEFADRQVRDVVYSSEHLSAAVLDATPAALWEEHGVGTLAHAVHRLTASRRVVLWERFDLAARLLGNAGAELFAGALGQSGRAREFTAAVISGDVEVPAPAWRLPLAWDGDLDALIRVMPVSELMYGSAGTPEVAVAAARLVVSLGAPQRAALASLVEDGAGGLTLGQALDAIDAASAT